MLERFERKYVDVHYTATGDGDSAGYEVILMGSFVICHNKQAQRWRSQWRMCDKKVNAWKLLIVL